MTDQGWFCIVEIEERATRRNANYRCSRGCWRKSGLLVRRGERENYFGKIVRRTREEAYPQDSVLRILDVISRGNFSESERKVFQYLGGGVLFFTCLYLL